MSATEARRAPDGQGWGPRWPQPARREEEGTPYAMLGGDTRPSGLARYSNVLGQPDHSTGTTPSPGSDLVGSRPAGARPSAVGRPAPGCARWGLRRQTGPGVAGIAEASGRILHPIAIGYNPPRSGRTRSVIACDAPIR